MKLGLIGAGNMASALARGIGEPVVVHDIDEAKARGARRASSAARRSSSNAEVAERSDVARPLPQARSSSRRSPSEVGGRAKVVVSILAATATERIADAYPGASVYRFIPNIPAEVKRGRVLLRAGPRRRRRPGGRDPRAVRPHRHGHPARRRAADRARDGADELRARLPGARGRAFADAGAAHGLDPDDAMRMVVETMGGTADYLARHGLRRPGAPRARGHAGRHDREGPDRARGARPAAT